VASSLTPSSLMNAITSLGTSVVTELFTAATQDPTTLDAGDLNNLMLSLPAEKVSELTNSQILSLTSSTMSRLSDVQVAALTNTQLAVLSPSQIDALGFKKYESLTPDQFNAINPTSFNIANLSQEQKSEVLSNVTILSSSGTLTKNIAENVAKTALTFAEVQTLAGAAANTSHQNMLLTAAYNNLATKGAMTVSATDLETKFNAAPSGQVTPRALDIVTAAKASSTSIPFIPLTVITDNAGEQIGEKPKATLDPTKNTVVLGLACGSSTPYSFSVVLPNSAEVRFTIASFQLVAVETVIGIGLYSTTLALPAVAGVSVELNCTDNTIYTVSFPAIDEVMLEWSAASSLPCFPKGARILTPAGYRTVETFKQGDLVTTADGRTVGVKVYSRHIKEVTKQTAPYLIPAHAFGRNSPPSDLRISPLHAFQTSKGVWQIPKFCSSMQAEQYGIGESVSYYHLECPDFFRDNLVVDGCIVESFAGKQVPAGISIYTPSRRLGGYTRISGLPSSVCKKN